MTAATLSNGSFLLLGASGGIGSAMARSLAAAGARVFLAARLEDRLAALAAEIGAPFVTAEADAFEQVASLFERATREIGPLSVVVNLADTIRSGTAAVPRPRDALRRSRTDPPQPRGFLPCARFIASSAASSSA